MTDTNLDLLKIQFNTSFYERFFKYLIHYDLDIVHKSKLIEYGLRTLVSVKELTTFFPERLKRGVTKDFRSLTVSWELILLFEELRNLFKGKATRVTKECLALFNWVSLNYQAKNLKRLARQSRKVDLLHSRLDMSIEELRNAFWDKHLNKIKGMAYNLVSSKLRFVVNSYGNSNKQGSLQQLLFDLMEYSYLAVNRSLVSPRLESVPHMLNTVKADLNKKVNSLIKFHKRQKRNSLQRVGKLCGKEVFKTTIQFSLDDLLVIQDSDNLTFGDVVPQKKIGILDFLIHQEFLNQYGLTGETNDGHYTY